MNYDYGKKFRFLNAKNEQKKFHVNISVKVRRIYYISGYEY